MTARTISLAELEARVPDATDIELPGPEGGWAVAVINGRENRALVAPVPVPAEPTPHNHREHVPGCFRCDLSSVEVNEV